MKKLIMTCFLMLGSSSFGHGFLIGTKVKTAQGCKLIEDIHQGDFVISSDSESVVPAKTLTRAFPINYESVYRVQVAGHDALYAATSQEFYVVGQGWLESHALREGHFVLNEELEPRKVFSVCMYKEAATTFAFAVSDNHNYFANGILVHNWNVGQ